VLLLVIVLSCGYDYHYDISEQNHSFILDAINFHYYIFISLFIQSTTVIVIKCGKVWSLILSFWHCFLSNVIIYRICKKMCLLPIGGAKSETFAQQPTVFKNVFLILRAAGEYNPVCPHKLAVNFFFRMIAILPNW
jgi:hypothetical protein